MAVKYGNTSPTSGKWGSTAINAIRHTNGNIYRFVDDIPVSVNLRQVISNDQNYANAYSRYEYMYYNGVYTPRSGWDKDDDGDEHYWSMTSSGLPSDGTLWRASKAGVLRNTKISVNMWRGGSSDDAFRIGQFYIRLVPENRWLVSEEGFHYGDTGTVPANRSWELGDVAVSADSRIVLYYQRVQLHFYDAKGYMQYSITGTLN